MVTYEVRIKRSFIVEGNIPEWLFRELQSRYGKALKVVEKRNEEAVDLGDTKWFQSVRRRLAPGASMRHYRQNRGLTQGELAEKLGPGVKKQHVSNMEKGIRGISKATAKKLAALFSTSVERFI